MDPDDECSSEVNTFCNAVGSSEVVVSRFIYTLPEWMRSQEEEEAASNDISYDEDGDVVVKRKQCEQDGVVVIQHKLKSRLRDVCSQIWRGSLFMADYLLSHPEVIRGKHVCEFGAGTGLTAIAASLCAPRTLIATDLDPTWLRRNTRGIRVEQWNLCQKEIPERIRDSIMTETEVFIGCDIVYDNDLTDGLVNVLEGIVNENINESAEDERLFLFSIEKRFAFTLADLDVTAPAFEYFMAKVEEIRDRVKNSISLKMFSTEDVEQVFCYERTDQLVLLEIRVTRKKADV